MSAIPRSRIAEAICRFALRGLIANGSAGPGVFVPLGRYAIHGHRLAAATASCLRFRITPGPALPPDR